MKFLKRTNIKVNKKELLIIFILLIVALFSFLIFRISGQGAKVEIKISQELYGTYDLLTDQEIIIKDKEGLTLMNSLIKNGKVQVLTSNCPDKICIESGSIEFSGQTIVCLPNKVVIKIIGDDAEIDGVLK